jgi:hypothetical protein
MTVSTNFLQTFVHKFNKTILGLLKMTLALTQAMFCLLVVSLVPVVFGGMVVVGQLSVEFMEQSRCSNPRMQFPQASG